MASVHRALAGDTFTAIRELKGRTLWVCYQAVFEADGTFTGSVAVTIDVTDQLADAEQAALARTRADTLAELAVALGREVVVPRDVLEIGVRIATGAMADAGVVWLLGDEDRCVEWPAAWHAEEEVRRLLRESLDGLRSESRWTDPARIRELESPVCFDRSDPVVSGGEASAAPPVLDDLGLVHGLRMPLRSRGRTIGAVDFVRDRRRGPFSDDDVRFAVAIGDRFTLAYDNALLLDEQREAVRNLVKFQSLADASDDVIAIADDHGQVTYLNPRARAIGPETPQPDLWVGMSDYLGKEQTQQMRTLVEAGERWRGDATVLVGDPAQEMHVHAEGFPLAYPDSGERFGVAWIGQDITHLRATERRLQGANAELGRFQALVETSSDFIAIAEMDGSVAYLNPAGRALVGMAPDEDVTTTTIVDYLTPEGLAQSVEVEQPAVRDHGSWEGESTLRRRGGEPVPVAISSFLMHDLTTGQPLGLATVQRDITRRLAAEQAVQHLSEQRQALLERLVQVQEAERAEIAAEVHDDPVQALAAVDLRLGLLRRRIEEHAPQLLDHILPLQDTVSRASDRLRALLFDLEAPDVARSLVPALEQVAEELYRDVGIESTVTAVDEPQAPVSLRTVAYRIVREALVNVRKHAGASRVHITVGSRDGGLLVEVADDGVGLGSGPTRSAPGHYGVTGMRDRATIAGGEVVFANRPEGGASVTLWLPGATAR